MSSTVPGRGPLVVWAGLFLVVGVAGATNGTCACTFTAADPEDCAVFGQLGDDVLIAYAKAPQACLDYHNIKVESIDPERLAAIFPNADGSGATPSGFVTYLRFEAPGGIKLSFDAFFDEGTTAGTAVLKDTIVIDGVTYECGASPTCWNTGLKTYFASEPGTSEMAAVGADLYDRQRFEKDLEQSTVRIAICNDDNDSPGDDAACDDLKAQIDGLYSKASACSAFGLGPAENAIPVDGCVDVDAAPRTAGSLSRALLLLLLGTLGLTTLSAI